MGRVTRVIGKHPILLTLLVVATLTVVPEVILRVLRWTPQSISSAQTPPHPRYLWVLEPGSYRHGRFTTTINRLGMRGRTPEDTVTGQRRILLVGDSSIFGWEVEDGETLAAALEREFDGRTLVFNGGVPGYSSEQSLLWLEELLPQIKPDLVVIANQWSDSTVSAFVDKTLLAETATASYRTRYYLLRLASSSRVWWAVRHWVLRSRGVDSLSRAIVDMRSQSPPGEGECRVPVEDYGRNLKAMVDMSRQAGAEVSLLMLAGFADLDEQEADVEEMKTLNSFREAMATVATETGCPLVRTEPVFRATGLSAPNLFVDGIHPSAKGHAAIAHALAKLLAEAGWEQGQPLCRQPLP